jgi:hypothetical protein
VNYLIKSLEGLRVILGVVVGYRDSRDEAEANGLGLVVGAQGTQKRKRWWRSGA